MKGLSQLDGDGSRFSFGTVNSFTNLDPNVVELLDTLVNRDIKFAMTVMQNQGLIIADNDLVTIKNASSAVLLIKKPEQNDDEIKFLLVRSKFSVSFSRLPYYFSGEDELEERYTVSPEEFDMLRSPRIHWIMWSMWRGRISLSEEQYYHSFDEKYALMINRVVSNANVKYSVSLPQGTKEADESFRHGGERELGEEANVHLKEKLQEIFRLFDETKGRSPRIIVLFLGILQQDDSRIHQSEWMTESDETSVAFWSSFKTIGRDFREHNGFQTRRLQKILLEAQQMERNLLEFAKKAAKDSQVARDIMDRDGDSNDDDDFFSTGGGEEVVNAGLIRR
jgi:ADP-ribose pyrophosphatase YjhB (NUDIX family)